MGGAMGKRALMPISTLEQIIDMLDRMDGSGLNEHFRRVHERLLNDLKTKVQKVELREDYAAIIRARTDDSRSDALNRYLENKRAIGAASAKMTDEESLMQAYYNKVCR